MRRHLMLSTAAIGLMLASGVAYAQSERRDEPKRSEEPAKGGAQHGQSSAQERSHGAQERPQSEHAQGAGRQEKGSERHQATEEKNAPSTAAEHNRSKASEQSQKEPSNEHNRAAESAKEHEKQGAREATKQEHETGKNSAETRQEKSGGKNSTAESDKSKNGSAGQQNERSGTAANQNEHNQNQPSRNSAEQQQGNRPSTATDTSRTPSTNNAQNAPSGANINQTDRASNTQVNQQSRVNSEKQVRMSETLSRARLAPPERDVNVSIRVGEAIPPHVHMHRLPPEIVSIEPEYRDYEYFSTDDDIVIVEPGTRRIVSEVPRDPSRARAQLDNGSTAVGGATSMAAAGGGSASGGNVNCKVMRRDASGNVAEVQPSTVGSSARTDTLSVTVQLPGGGSSSPITLGASAGDIVVATQGQGDCTVTLEPQR